MYKACFENDSTEIDIVHLAVQAFIFKKASYIREGPKLGSSQESRSASKLFDSDPEWKGIKAIRPNFNIEQSIKTGDELNEATKGKVHL